MSGKMAEVTRETEGDAFEKIDRKLARVHPTNRQDETEVLVKLTVLDLRSIMNFWRRYSHDG